jgi:hypothetical protein
MNDKDLLNKVKIAAPCSVPWESMSGDDRVRHCGQCQLNVYNLSAMSTKEAAKFLRSATEGRVCIQLYRRKDGTILTDNCPKGLKKARDRITAVWIATCLFLGIGIVGNTAQGRFSDYSGIAGGISPMKVIDESVRRNYLSTLISTFVFLKLGIPLLNPHQWWKKYWPIASFFFPFMVGMFVDSLCNSLWPGAGWDSANPELECFVTGCLFGLSCLVTAAIFHKSLPLASEPSRAESKNPTRKL